MGEELNIKANDGSVQDAHLKIYAINFVRVHKGITDPETIKKVLECNPPCKDYLLDATSGKNSASKQSQKIHTYVGC